MSPRLVAGLSGNFSAGARLAQFVAVILSLLSVEMFAASAFAASNVIQYTYDPAGNITNITRQSTGGLAITGFSPNSGAVGTAVTVYGTGFSATPANNTVKFNGVTATVTASDSGSIATTVPTSATTGRITVTVGGNTATSAQDFVVTVAGAPTIASFTPTIGGSGTSVAVTGTNFNATTGATVFKLNGVSGTGDASSTTAGSFAIPTSASSGRITATTSVGTGTSTNDFIVPPTGLTAGDLETTTRMSAGGGNVQVTVGTPNRSALILFDGAANGWYSLHFRALDVSPTSASVSYKVIKPDNSQLIAGTVSMGSITSLHLPKLTASGTYSLLLSPGTATLNTLVRLEANPALTLDGAAVASTLDYALQSSRFTFEATSGQRIGVGAKNVTFTPAIGSARLYIFKPDGSALGGYTTCLGSQSDNTAGHCATNFVAPATGTYTIVVDNTNLQAYTSTSVQLSSPVTGALSTDVTQAVSLTRVGQQASYTFTVASGDGLAVDISNLALAPQAGAVTMYILRPDGTQLTYCSPNQPAGAVCQLGTPPAGTYTAFIDPAYGAYGTFNVTVKNGPLLTTTSAPSSFAPTGTSEIARARFVATAGQTLSVGVGGLTYVGSGGTSSFNVHRADGTSLDSANCLPSWGGGNCRLTVTNLAAGNYSIIVRGPAGVKISGTLTLSADVTGALTLGTTQPVSIARVGQRAAYTFSGTSGDNVGVSLFTPATSPASETLRVKILKPDGSQLTSGQGSQPVFFNALLNTTGTHTAIVESDGPTFTANLLVDAGAMLTLDGSTASPTADAAGKPIRYRFTGTSGQRIELGLLGLAYATSSSSTTSMRVWTPDNSQLANNACTPSTGEGSCEYSNPSLGMNGTYVVLLTPPAASQITGGTLALSSPLTGTFVVSDPAQTIAISRPGQTARYTFSGTSAQTLRLNWSSVTVAGTGSVTVTVLNPSGGTVNSSSFTNGASGGFDIAALPSTGTYTVVFDPPSGTTMSGSFSLVTR